MFKILLVCDFKCMSKKDGNTFIQFMEGSGYISIIRGVMISNDVFKSEEMAKKMLEHSITTTALMCVDRGLKKRTKVNVSGFVVSQECIGGVNV
ncbi:hypothetical protein AGMMS49592_0510 [Endomicrobiia bacterium]|nr:hypothetical protein AGMMS49592_0510 [Endomicrobiia bacterium]